MIINLFEQLLESIKDKRMFDLMPLFQGKEYSYKELQHLQDLINQLKNHKYGPKRIAEKFSSDVWRMLLELQVADKAQVQIMVETIDKELNKMELRQLIVFLKTIINQKD